MRLYDWLMRHDAVYVERSSTGHLLISDRYVILDGSVPDFKSCPDAPGEYQVFASRPATLEHAVTAGVLERKVREYRDVRDADWYDITWSEWTHGTKIPARVGSLNGAPCAVNHTWLSRLPKEYVLSGYRPDKPFRIQRVMKVTGVRNGSKDLRTTVGIVMPIRLAKDSMEVPRVIAADLDKSRMAA